MRLPITSSVASNEWWVKEWRFLEPPPPSPPPSPPPWYESRVDAIDDFDAAALSQASARYVSYFPNPNTVCPYKTDIFFFCLSLANAFGSGSDGGGDDGATLFDIAAQLSPIDAQGFPLSVPKIPKPPASPPLPDPLPVSDPRPDVSQETVAAPGTLQYEQGAVVGSAVVDSWDRRPTWLGGNGGGGNLNSLRGETVDPNLPVGQNNPAAAAFGTAAVVGGTAAVAALGPYGATTLLYSLYVLGLSRIQTHCLLPLFEFSSH